MSSWDAYLDTLVGHSKDCGGAEHIDHACIIGLNGGGKWTTDGHEKSLKIHPQECATIARCFATQDYTPFMSNGIRIADEKYNFLRQEESVVYGKMKSKGSITLQATKKAIVIAHCPEGGQHGTCNKAVNTIAEHLTSAGM